MKKGDVSKFVEEAVRWRVFHQTVREAREALAGVPLDDLQREIDKRQKGQKEGKRDWQKGTTWSGPQK